MERYLCNGIGRREKNMMTKARSKIEDGERRKMIDFSPPQIFPKTGALPRPIVRIAE